MNFHPFAWLCRLRGHRWATPNPQVHLCHISLCHRCNERIWVHKSGPGAHTCQAVA